MYDVLIADIAALVQEACAAEGNVFGYGIWTHHILQVRENVRRLAPLFDADIEIVELAALLHDYAGIRDASLHSEHHLHGAEDAGRILARWGYDAERTAAVQHCIIAHRASVRHPALTPEALCVANADALAHLRQVPSLLYYAYVHRGLCVDEGADWVAAKLRRTWNKLDAQVQRLAQAEYDAALIVLRA
jgi:uncharacterized protein